MALNDCPLPDVARALELYIRPRHEVTNIRNALHAHLRDHVCEQDAPLTSVNLDFDHKQAKNPLLLSPSGLTGVRKAYVEALRAHAAAWTEYESMKRGLNQLGTSNEMSARPKTMASDFFPLLKQRERRRKLRILERAIPQINAEGERVVSQRPEDAVDHKVGPLPLPPSNEALHGVPTDVEEQIFQLKRAILTCQKHKDTTKTTVPDELSALQQAHMLLTEWIEDQLSIIGAGEADDPSSNVMPGETLDISHVEAMYERYVAIRQRLIDTVNRTSPPDISREYQTPGPERPTSATDRVAVDAEAVLPYLSRLGAAKRREETAERQRSQLRQVMENGQSDNGRLVARLVDESHLVEPSTMKIDEWATAARERERTTETMVRQQLQTGQAFITQADNLLEERAHINIVLN
ncbi:hypothetical protein K470DRAFT_210894 [Piedraia hortae CBS 480.64]|uniref:Uncharacterized protein n=1 Tax=Piedraia hortae CBS 480.64 TaxID=1314780 RepID=A0A6A7C8N8_9PEZI|nr:hypothetical protein K470DRAFT_210894 [Piedraia hortae CBS 480.64]